MSYLLFMDESGHDHKRTPYEIHGGIALDCKKVFSVVREIMDMEKKVFGCHLKEYNVELKGSKLLQKETFKWANNYTEELLLDERQKHVRRFLTAALEKKAPTRKDFYAYGQARLLFVRRALEILCKHEVKLFAAAIPRGIQKPKGYASEDYLRKDLVFLFERYAKFLERQHTNGCSFWTGWKKYSTANLQNRFTTISSGRITAEKEAVILSRNLFLWIP